MKGGCGGNCGIGGGEGGSHGLDREETLEEFASRSQTAVFRDVVYSASSVGEEAVPYYEMRGAGNVPWGASLLENVAVVGADRAVKVGLVPLIYVCVQSQRLGVGLVHCCLEPAGGGAPKVSVSGPHVRHYCCPEPEEGGAPTVSACWSFSTFLESSSIRLFRHLQRMQIFSSGLQRRSHN